MRITTLQSRDKKLSLQKPLIMGILNVTPDSFSDGGQFLDISSAVNHAHKMVADGADIIDIGGESSGPNSKDITLEEELKRVLPVLKKLRSQTDAWISVDTYKSEVAQQALDLGADMMNDVTALRGDFKMASVLAKYDVPVVLMYSKDPSARTTREKVEYKDVIKTLSDFLEQQIQRGIQAGIKRERFVVDPGMGAFVSGEPKYSLEILNRLKEFETLNLPILVGASRKGFIGEILNGLQAGERLEGSLACAAVATLNGASILRVHDVKETRRVVDMIYAIKNS